MIKSDNIRKRRLKINYLRYRYRLNYLEAKELSYVIDICLAQNLIYSRDLSNFIRFNGLGRYFPNICGILYMDNGCNQWKFIGGFPSNIYRILCNELNLKGRGSNATTIGFKPFKCL